MSVGAARTVNNMCASYYVLQATEASSTVTTGLGFTVYGLLLVGYGTRSSHKPHSQKNQYSYCTVLVE